MDQSPIIGIDLGTYHGLKMIKALYVWTLLGKVREGLYAVEG